MADTAPIGATRAQLLNIAFSFAFIISITDIPIRVLLFSFIEHPIFSNLPAYQQQISLFFVSYWIPAILIYLILTCSRIGPWLQLRGSAYGALVFANIVGFSLFTARFASSLVPSAGGGLIIGVFSLFFIAPAVILIIYGYVRMIASSIRYGTSKKSEKGITQSSFNRTLVVVALAIPILFGVFVEYNEGSPFQAARRIAPLFDQRCKDAVEVVYIDRSDAKSIFIADSKWLTNYGHIKNGFYREYAESTPPFMLLTDYELDFVESEAYSSSSEYRNGFKYWRFDKGFPADPAKRYAVSEPASNYAYSSNEITNKQDKELGITGYRMEVIDRRSHEVIASKTYYIHKAQSRICGYAPNATLSAHAFVQSSLNLKLRAE